MAKKISVFREHDVNYLKDYLVEAVREVLNEASPPNMKLGAGTDLEQAIVDALNGKSPKHFQDFVLAAAEDIKNRLAPQATPATKLENGTISSNWKKWGGADTTSKADVQFGKDGVSMKMGPDAMLFGFGPGDAQACMQAAIMTPNLQSGPKAQALLVKLGEMQQAIGRAPLSVLKRAKEMEADLAQTASADDALDKAARSIGAGDEGYVMDPAARAGLKKQIAKAKKGDAAAFNRIKKGIEKGQLALSNGSTGPEAAANYNLGDTLIAASDASKKTKKDADYKTKFDPKMQQKEAMDGINTIEQLMSHAEEILNLEKTLQEIEKEVVALLDPTGNDDLRLAFFKEALTGEQKFGKGSENVATHVYITQGSKQLASAMTGNRSKDLLNVKNLHIYKALDDAYIEQIANAATWRGKFRSDSIKVGKKKTGYNLYRSSLIAEIKTASPGGKEYLDKFKNMLSQVVKEAIAEGLITEVELLEEGWLGDMATNVLGGVKKVAAAAIKKGAESWRSFIDKLSTSFKGLIRWFKYSIAKIAGIADKLFGALREALNKGTAGIVEFFGFTPEELADAIEPPPDTKTSVFVSQIA